MSGETCPRSRLIARHHIQKILKDGGFETFGTLAFAISAFPSNLDESEVCAWIQSMFAAGSAADQTAKARRRVSLLTSESDPGACHARRGTGCPSLGAEGCQQVFSPETLPAYSIVDVPVKR